MTQFVLEAELREKTGKAESRRLRRAGKIPGIIYGGGKPDLPIMMDYFTVSKQLNNELFFTSMIEVKVKGSRTKNTGLLKDTQWDPLMDTIKHLDIFRVEGSDIVHAEVPVLALNEDDAPGVKQGGMIQLIRHHLEVSCRADSIPAHIEVDCSKLEMHEAVHIRDITLPAGVTVPELEVELEEGEEEVNFSLLTCIPPMKEEAVEEEEAVEGEEGEEAAEGEADADSEEEAKD